MFGKRVPVGYSRRVTRRQIFYFWYGNLCQRSSYDDLGPPRTNATTGFAPGVNHNKTIQSGQGIRGETSGLSMLDCLKRSFANFVRQNSVSMIDGQSVEGAQISTHTTTCSVSFRLQPPDAYLRRLAPDQRGQPSRTHKTLFCVTHRIGLVTQLGG